MTTEKTALTLATVWVFSYLWIEQQAFYCLLTLIIIDTFLWYITAHLCKDFQSTKAYIWLMKKVVIIFIPISIALYWLIIDKDVSTITAWIFALLWIAQIYSIIWHIYHIKTWQRISEYDAMTIVIKYIWDKVQNVLENLLKK